MQTHRGLFVCKVQEVLEHIKEVRDILNKKRLVYKEREKVAGHLETHSVNFLVPANRRAGLAIAVLPGHNSHLIAEAWGFKCDDIRGVNSNLKIGLVYDVSGETWGVESRHILEKKADLAVASDSLPTFEERLPS